MSAQDIQKARILKEALDKHYAEIAPSRLCGPNAPCPACKDVGLIQVDSCIRYCTCNIGREKKREWLAHPALDRAPFEAEVPTLPDAEELGLRGRR